jgi:ribosomal protein L11 methyltransferase
MQAFFMNYIQVDINTPSTEICEILIAELSEISFDAFEENESNNIHVLSAFIPEDGFDEGLLVKTLLKFQLTYNKKIIPPENWNAKWEKDFEPIRIDNYVSVRAAFHLPARDVMHDIIITPKMSFGTGHHDTTYMMLAQMKELDFNGRSVLDFGTGTGVLAILAKRSGAGKVVAIDNDEWSITNAAENISANNCTGIELQQREDPAVGDKFDIILANINLNVIIQHTAHLVDISKPGTQMLLSGFLQIDEKAILENFNKAAYKHVNTLKRNDWLSILLTKS